MINIIPSIYLAMASGWMGCVSRKDLMIVERKIWGKMLLPLLFLLVERCGYQS